MNREPHTRGKSGGLAAWLIPILLFAAGFASRGLDAQQQLHPGHGAMSAQDMAPNEMVRRAAKTDAMRAGAAEADPADAVCARYPAGSVTTAPPELKSVNGVLEVTMQFLTATDAKGLVRYCYVTNTGLEAPTLRVNPGDHLIIHFQNGLPAATATSASTASGHSDNMAGMDMTLAAPKDASASGTCTGAMSALATNIHFHGLNVSPLCGQDEVVHTLVQPGQSFEYNVLIPSNEPPGLYWYHPHPHGFSEGQVQGGATGALIVEGLQTVDTALAGMTERTFVLRDQLLPIAEANDADVPAWDVSINFVPVNYPGYTPAVIQTNPAQQELWRVANTAADTIMNLQYVVDGTAQTLQLVAIDGFPIAGGTSGQVSASETTILMPPGSRAEFVVTTPNVGDQAQLTTQYWNTGPDGDYDPTRVLATVVSQNGAENAAVSVGSSSTAAGAQKRLPARKAGAAPAKVTRFAALDAAVPVAQRNLFFSEVLEDPSDPNSPTNFYITEAGQTPALFTMDQPPNIVVHSGTVEDWVISNTAEEDHIFHIHQLHFQVLEVNGQAVNDPAIRDTVDLPYWSGTGAYPSVKVRMDFRDPNIVGTFVYHCHILQHEDAGMMGEIQVIAPGAASATTATASTASVTPNGSITLTAHVADAATGASTPTGLVQFQINNINVGNPVTVTGGQATLTTAINGVAGSNKVTAFYEGDSTYSESASSVVPITISDFALSSPGATAAVGSAAIANVTVSVATDYTLPITFTCTMPGTLTESACFVDPNSQTGPGVVALRVNTTPSHTATSSLQHGSGWLKAGGATTLACLLLGFVPRRGSSTKRRGRREAMLLLGLVSALLVVAGCSSGVKTDAGTPKGTYNVVVNASSGSGAAQYQASVNVPITIQ